MSITIRKRGRPRKVFLDGSTERPEPMAASSIPAPSVESPTETKSPLDRKVLTFFVNENGEIAWDRMQDGTRDEFKEFVNRPDVRKNLGLETTEKTIEQLAFGEDEANAFLDLLGGIDSFAAAKLYSIPAEITSQAFTFTPDHRKKLVPVYSRLMNKWAPMMLKTWKDEIGATILTIAVINSQVRVMHMLEDKRKKNLPASSRVTSISDAPTTGSIPVPEKPIEESPVEKSDDILENVGINA